MIKKIKKSDDRFYENSAMNKELVEWIKASKDQIKQRHDKDSNTFIEKKAKGKCQICGKNKAKFVCLKCEKPVCPSCYFNIIGVCKICVPKEYVEIWEKKNPDWKEVLDVDWIR